MTAIQALLEGLIDYAGLFPPAGLDMITAVRNYAAYRAGEHAWALGQFIVPAQRLIEFADAFDEVCCAEQDSPWQLSVIVSRDQPEDAESVMGFRMSTAFISGFEYNAGNEVEMEWLRALGPSTKERYIEILPEKCVEIIPILKNENLRAKIRTGGIVAGAFPQSQQVASFLVSCAQAKVPFKATAGLHHPIRSAHKITYEAQSASTLMHGFINVFVAAISAYFGATVEDVTAVLDEQNPSAFQWSRHALAWRGQKFSTEQIKDARTSFAISFGSCSFTEPINDLISLGWL